jgi:hypothetical protein
VKYFIVVNSNLVILIISVLFSFKERKKEREKERKKNER